MSTNHAARSYPGVFKKKKTMLQDNICNLNSNFDLVSNFQLIFYFDIWMIVSKVKHDR